MVFLDCVLSDGFTLLAGTDRRTRAARPSFRSATSGYAVERDVHADVHRTRAVKVRREGKGGEDHECAWATDADKSRAFNPRRVVGRAPPLGAVSRQFQHSRRSGDSRPAQSLHRGVYDRARRLSPPPHSLHLERLRPCSQTSPHRTPCIQSVHDRARRLSPHRTPCT